MTKILVVDSAMIKGNGGTIQSIFANLNTDLPKGVEQNIISPKELIKTYINIKKEYDGLVIPSMGENGLKANLSAYGHEDYLINSQNLAMQILNIHYTDKKELPKTLVHSIDPMGTFAEIQYCVKKNNTKGIEFLITNDRYDNKTPWEESYVDWVKKL